MDTGRTASMSQTVAFSIQPEVMMRFLGPEDIPEVKRLCAEWFPIEYPDTWYKDITSNCRFYSLAAIYKSHIVGIVVSEVKPVTRCNKEDTDILASHFPPNTQVAYILSLGIMEDFRRHGIASLLLDNLLAYLRSPEMHTCKAVYLHVLTTNKVAILFYERRNFRQHNYLPYYYSIKGQPRDGYSYVLYLNGGHPPWSVFDHLRQWSVYMSKTPLCILPQRIYQSIQSVWRRFFALQSNTSLQQVRFS